LHRLVWCPIFQLPKTRTIRSVTKYVTLTLRKTYQMYRHVSKLDTNGKWFTFFPMLRIGLCYPLKEKNLLAEHAVDEQAKSASHPLPHGQILHKTNNQP
jgi:hypothetical protein